MNGNQPLVTSAGFKQTTPEVKQHKHTNKVPTVRNTVLALFTVLAGWMGAEYFSSDPVVDAKAKLGWTEDKLIDPENMDVSTTEFDQLDPSEKMEVRSLCEKISAIPVEYYKDAEGNTVSITTQRMHEIADVLITEFEKEKNSDKKYMMIWLLCLLASWGFGTLLHRRYKKQDNRNKDAYFHALFDEVKEYRGEGLEKNTSTAKESIETTIDEYIGYLRTTHDVVIGATYDPIDQPLQSFIASKIEYLVGLKTTTIRKVEDLCQRKKIELEAARSPDAVKAITLDGDFQSILTQLQIAINLVKSSIAEQEKDLHEQQNLKQEALLKKKLLEGKLEEAKQEALLLSAGGLITDDNKEAITHFLDEMKDGEVTEQNMTDLGDFQKGEMDKVLARQREIEELIIFDAVSDFVVDSVDDFVGVGAEYARIEDLYTRSVALGYTETSMNDHATEFATLQGLQSNIARLEGELLEEHIEDDFELDFTEDAFSNLESKVSKKDQLTGELERAKDSYRRKKQTLEQLLKSTKGLLDVFLHGQQSTTSGVIEKIKEKHAEEMSRMKTLYEVRQNRSTKKQDVLNDMMTHIEGGVAEEKRGVEQKIERLETERGELNSRKLSLETEIGDLESREKDLSEKITPLLEKLLIEPDKSDYLSVFALVERILTTSLTGEGIPAGCTSFKDIVVQKEDGGYMKKPGSDIGQYMVTQFNNPDGVFKKLLLDLSSLGQLVKLIEERDAVVDKLGDDRNALSIVTSTIDTNESQLLEANELLVELTSQVENSEKQKAALEIIKAALSRVIDKITSTTDPVTYDTLEAVQAAFDEEVVQVIFELNNAQK